MFVNIGRMWTWVSAVSLLQVLEMVFLIHIMYTLIQNRVWFHSHLQWPVHLPPPPPRTAECPPPYTVKVPDQFNAVLDADTVTNFHLPRTVECPPPYTVKVPDQFTAVLDADVTTSNFLLWHAVLQILPVQANFLGKVIQVWPPDWTWSWCDHWPH